MNLSLIQIRQDFLECFKGHGYVEQPAAKVSSGIDPTVIFVGSNISGLKRYILGNIPDHGMVIDQPSMRFRELGRLFDPNYRPVYGSYFNELGAIVPYKQPDSLVEQMREYLTDYLGLHDNDLLARTNSKDPDLLALARNSFTQLETDSRPDKYYRHTIGEKGFVGRNFNIAIRNKSSGNYEDIGNFLAFQRDGKDAFVEVALGDTVIHRSMHGHEHVLDCYGVTVPHGLNRTEALNFTNSVIVTTVLYREGLRATNRNNQEKILSKYMRYLSSLKQEDKVSLQDIATGIQSFEDSYYGDRSNADTAITADLVEREPAFRKTIAQQLGTT